MEDKKNILIVDDEADFRDIFSIKLKANGFDVDEAVNGKDALEKLAEKKPDLVLLDVNMPEMDGAETIFQIHARPEFAGLKVIFLTNYGDPIKEMKSADEKFAKEMGAADYIRKSEDLDIAMDRIKSVLGI